MITVENSVVVSDEQNDLKVSFTYFMCWIRNHKWIWQLIKQSEAILQVLLSSRPKCCYHRYVLIYLPTFEVITLNGSLRSSFLASCKDPGIPLNGSRTGDNFEQGETVSFSCNRGYTLIGRKVIRCHKRVWSSSLPQCKSKWLSFRVDVST